MGETVAGAVAGRSRWPRRRAGVIIYLQEINKSSNTKIPNTIITTQKSLIRHHHLFQNIDS
ncbi:hypothetical protein MTR_5g077960 [Medicago truncatula]|uniref:Uncharacterized protein n=1 Tax=Medicago truncatula TaxID=3880 RepID=G7KG35_MEDTR|nr:hypothetical protein MTR_5g077960 [Medicago truncatula]